jgi:hypothetical protein
MKINSEAKPWQKFAEGGENTSHRNRLITLQSYAKKAHTLKEIL